MFLLLHWVILCCISKATYHKCNTNLQTHIQQCKLNHMFDSLSFMNGLSYEQVYEVINSFFCDFLNNKFRFICFKHLWPWRHKNNWGWPRQDEVTKKCKFFILIPISIIVFIVNKKISQNVNHIEAHNKSSSHAQFVNLQ